MAAYTLDLEGARTTFNLLKNVIEDLKNEQKSIASNLELLHRGWYGTGFDAFEETIGELSNGQSGNLDMVIEDLIEFTASLETTINETEGSGNEASEAAAKLN